MNRFTIKNIENLSGIKAHTLRIWEQRYNLIVPKRKESNHRFYDNEDLKHILRIAYLYHNGYKISKIAGLKQDELKKLSAGQKNFTSPAALVNQMIEAAIDFDEEQFENILLRAVEMFGFEICITNVVYPYFEKIGMLWLHDSAMPAQEHFASNIIRNKLIVRIDKLKKPENPDRGYTLLFTPEGEYHEIPLLFIYYLLKKNNVPVIYAGTSVSNNVIETLCDSKKIPSLHFHLITNFMNMEPGEYVTDACKRFSNKQIIMSGPVINSVTAMPSNFRMLQSMDDIMAYTQGK